MCFHVPVQDPALGECLVAEVALEGLLAGVLHFVPCQVA